VVLNVAFGEPTIAVDTHIFRVSNRTGLAPGKNVLEVEQGLEKAVPDHYKSHAHHWLILHGRYVCKARTPECWRCVIADLCRYKQKTPAAEVYQEKPERLRGQPIEAAKRSGAVKRTATPSTKPSQRLRKRH